jgi:predicted dehydrogenase
MPTMAEKTRIAVVGAGHVAQVAHIPAYRANPDAELVAVVDYDMVKARRIKDQFGFQEAYDDINEMLKKSQVDAVDICTPNYLHAPMAIAALRSGHDVLVEKPFSRNAKEAEQMVAMAEKHDRVLMVAMNNRFREDAQMLQKFVNARELGDVHIVKAGWLRRATDWKDRAWFTERGKAGGGAMLDLGIPLLDLAMWIAGLVCPQTISENGMMLFRMPITRKARQVRHARGTRAPVSATKSHRTHAASEIRIATSVSTGSPLRAISTRK